MTSVQNVRQYPQSAPPLQPANPPTSRRSPARLARDLVTESRPPVQVVFILRYLAASRLIVQPNVQGLVGIAGWIALTVAIYVYNGVSDLTSDVANGSTRPIASGRLPVTTARRCCAGLVLIGLGLCALAGWKVGVAGLGFVALGWLYSAGRGLKANAAAAAAVIGAGAALTYLAGAATAPQSTDYIWTLVAIAAWVTLACSSKDFSDQVGDALAGRRTLPVVLGAPRAAWLLAVTSLLLSTAFWACAAATDDGSITLCTVLLVGTVIFVWRLGVAVRSRQSGRRTAYRAYMAVQYVINVGLGVGLL